MSRKIELIDEENMYIKLSKHQFFPSSVIVGSLFSYLKTISSKECLIVISKTVYSHIKDKLDPAMGTELARPFIFEGEPTQKTLERFQERIDEKRYDYVLAIGGGSVIDLAKTSKKKNIPLIVAPTTPGTGSEATQYIPLFDENSGKKKVLSSQEYLPSVVILDSTLLRTMTSKQLGYSIMDLLSHSLEALVSKRSSSLSDAYALESIRLVLDNFDKTDNNYLENVMVAGFLGGMAQGMASVGLIHGLAHYFGARYGIKHSKAISLFIEEVLQFNLSKTELYGKVNSLKVMDSTKIIEEIRKIKSYFSLEDQQIEVEPDFDEEEAALQVKNDVCTLTNPVRPTQEEIINIFASKIKKKIDGISQDETDKARISEDLEANNLGFNSLESNGYINQIIESEPFSLCQKEKEVVFLKAMKESLKHHSQNNEMFLRFLNSKEFTFDQPFNLEDIPFLPVSIFKEAKLITGQESDIKKIVRSSSTSGKKPSVIYLDQKTILRQRKVLANILSGFLGKKRVFIIFDARETISFIGEEISSRASAIGGLLPFAKKAHFVLDKDLKMVFSSLEQAIDQTSPDDEICFFGFTWLLFKTIDEIRKNPLEAGKLKEKLDKLSKNRIILHIGGWKKLQNLSVDKQTFNSYLEESLGVSTNKVVDFYGMSEQLGTVYPDCEYGYKHLPLYSELIIRDVNTLEPCPKNKPGFIQLLTPIPNSYPGISIITDDIGEIKGSDDCLCGRKGKYFIFQKRAEKAEIKGCGDTLE